MERVLVDIPFVYRIEAVRQRRRKPETIYQVDTVPVEIRVATDAVPFSILAGPCVLKAWNPVRGFVLDGVAYTELEALAGVGDDHRTAWSNPDFFSTYAPDGFDAVDPRVQRSILIALHRDERCRLGIDTFVPRIEGLSRILSSDRDEKAVEAVEAVQHLVYGSGMLASSRSEPVLHLSKSVGDSYVEDMSLGNWRHAHLEDDHVAYGMAYAATLDPMSRPRGIPKDVDRWSFPDAEKLMEQTWSAIENIRPHFTAGSMRGVLERMQEMRLPAAERRLEGTEVLEVADIFAECMPHVSMHGARVPEMDRIREAVIILRKMASLRSGRPAPFVQAGTGRT